MRISAKATLLVLAAAGAGAVLSGCANTPPDQSAIRLSDDFGQAVSQDLAAQIADPDAAAREGPPPPSNGARAALAQTRYEHDAVTPPSASTTQSAGGSGGSGGSGGAGMSGATGGP